MEPAAAQVITLRRGRDLDDSALEGDAEVNTQCCPHGDPVAGEVHRAVGDDGGVVADGNDAVRLRDQTTFAATAGLTNNGTPAMTRAVGLVGSAPSSALLLPVVNSLSDARINAVAGLVTNAPIVVLRSSASDRAASAQSKLVQLSPASTAVQVIDPSPLERWCGS